MYHNALLPHEAYKARQMKLRELHRFSGLRWEESLRPNLEPHVLAYVTMGKNEAHMNFPDIMFAPPKVGVEALKISTSWPF